MTTLPTSLRHALGILVLGAAAVAAAAPANYQCEGGTLLTADFSPRQVQLHLEGQQWTLLRVREAHDARYVAARAGMAITLLRNQALLERKGQPDLSCKLQVRALSPEALGTAPPANTTPR